MPGIDDVDATPILLFTEEPQKVCAAMTLRMYPPRAHAALVFDRMAERWSLSKATAPVGTWQPPRSQPTGELAIYPGGRMIVTSGGMILYDDSNDAEPADRFDHAWRAVAQETRHALVLVGGPDPLDTTEALDAAAHEGRLIGTWVTSTIPDTAPQSSK